MNHHQQRGKYNPCCCHRRLRYELGSPGACRAIRAPHTGQPAAPGAARRLPTFPTQQRGGRAGSGARPCRAPGGTAGFKEGSRPQPQHEAPPDLTAPQLRPSAQCLHGARGRP